MQVLHLTGSPTSAFFRDLSLLYARGVARPAGTDHRVAVAEPDGSWALFEEPRPGRADSGPCRRFAGLGAFLDHLASSAAVDVVVPHMFCPVGRTTVRDLFETGLGLPLYGSPGAVCAVADDKAATRARLATAGVPIPEGEILGPRNRPTLDPPYVVKPAREDNSRGLGLVRPGADAARVDAALAAARAYDDRVVAERFVPGRELRAAVLETASGRPPSVLPVIEYRVSEAHPIRALEDKLDVGPRGTPRGQTSRRDVPWSCPATLDAGLARRVTDVVTAAHAALGARDVSLWDLRVDAESGEVFVLEAGLFWSFSPESMVSRMLAAGAPRDRTDSGSASPETASPAAPSLDETARAQWRRAVERGAADRGAEERGGAADRGARTAHPGPHRTEPPRPELHLQ